MEKEGKLVSSWEMLYKDNEGEGHVKTLHKYDYEQNADPEHSFLSQAAPTIISSPEIAPRRSKSLLLADIPDIHYGFRKIDGILVPTHQPEVMDVSLQIIKKEQPNLIIIGGDAIDAPNVGKYEMDSLHFVDTMQLCIDGLYKYFSRLREDNPNAEIVHLRGNHEERFNKFLLRNAPQFFGLKRADAQEYPAISYPSLLRLDDLDIKYTDNYKINDRLMTNHGELVGTPSAQKYLARYAMSLMFHHDHRRGYEKRVFPDGKSIEAFGFGCQADVKGSIPSYHSKVGEMGEVVERFENWNQGLGMVEYKKGDKPFQTHAIAIEAQDNYEAQWQKRVYKAREEVAEAFKTGK